MSASSSAGTSLKLNGETSLHKAKALAIPRRVSLAFIRLVGKESSLSREKPVKTGLQTAHLDSAGAGEEMDQWPQIEDQ